MANYAEYLDKIRNSKLLYFDSLPLGLTSCEYNTHLLLNKMAETMLLMDNERSPNNYRIAYCYNSICFC